MILLLPIAVPSLIRHSYRRLNANPETADAFEDVVADIVADHLLPDYVPDALADAVGDFVADAFVDLVTDDDDDGDDADDEDGRTTPSSPSCSLSDDEFANDPDMRTLVFATGYGPQEFRAYVQPDVSTFYRGDDDDDGSPRGGGGVGVPAAARKKPRHPGIAAKFVNLSTRRVRLAWCPGDGGPCGHMDAMGPFESSGTASFPDHVFRIEDYDTAEILAEHAITPPVSVYYYDGITVNGDPDATKANIDKLSEYELEAYRAHVDSRNFAERYYRFTGRQYLSMYPRDPPGHKMWPASYFGQEHWVTTRETHFVSLPPLSDLGPVVDAKATRRLGAEEDERHLSEYRDASGPYLNMTLRVISCAPRAFEIENFLSASEVEHVLHLTSGLSLRRSTTSGGDDRDRGEEEPAEETTRTSLNTWVYREKDAIVDAIYRRASDLLRIDEALLRRRSPDEYPEMGNSDSLAEALQLVHYDVGQEYTAHHDFGYARYRKKGQPARFATLLLYLNEGMVGGETQFPRWVNAETSEGLKVVPKTGKAVLFYSMLPDGNMDDLSHHAALPVRVGEKWLMNLW